jgi:PAS domain S-box-containing protein
VVWVYGRILPEYNHQGEYIGYVGTLTDITDRKEAELELQRNQESLRKAELFNRLAVEASGIGIWELDLTTNDSYISPKMAELMDYSPQERTIPQEKWLNSIIPADREMVKDTIATCKLTGSFFNLEFRILLKNGKQRWLYSRGGLTYDPAGQPQIISGCTLDITDRKALEQEKQEAQQQLEDLNEELETKIEERTLELSKINSFQQAILNSTSYAIIATDVHGIIQTFNKGAELISGYTALEMIGKHTPEVLHDPIEIINQYQELCRELGEDITLGFEVFVAKARRNLVTEDEWTYIRKDGSRFPILLSVTALRNKEQEIIGFVGIAKDITQTKRIEQERAKLAQRLEIALNSAAIGSWDWDLQSNEVTWDERMFQLYGRTPTPDYKVPYQEWRNWAEPNSLALAESQLSETLLQGTPFEIELCIYHPDRSIHYLQVYAIVIRDHANQPIRIIGVNYDITKRKQAERELQESEARWQFALEGAGDGIWDLNVQTRTVFYSSKWKTMLGYEDHEIEGNVSAWINLLHPDDRERCLNHAEQYLQGNIPTYELEHRLRCKDGHYKWILSRGKLIEWTAEGQPLRLVGTHTDLTVIRQAEAENRLLKDRLEFLVGSSPAIIYSCKTEYDFATTFISKNVKNVLGYDPEHFLDESDFWIRHIHPEDQVRTPDEIGLLFAQGCHQYEYRFVHQEGHYVWVRDEMELIRDADGEPLDIVGYVADITAIKQAEVQLRRTNEELMRATRLKDEFLANMSHELRTPLNSILGLTEALAEGLLGHLNEKQRQSLETVANSANHLLALINDILDVAKIESGQVVLDCQPVAVAPLCQSSLAFVKQLALTKRVQLSLNLPLSLPPLMVDERRIRQVLINLLNNAVKFTPEGGRVTLEVSQLSPQERPGSQGYAPDPQEQYSYLRLAVIDTGIGIAPEDAQKLFKPFVQIDSALNREYQGTGLGLALVKNIVELHGGKVSLSSQPGQGSRFMIDLPAAAIVSTIPMNSNIPVSTSEYLVEEEETTSAPLILLVEDNQANVLTVTNYLTAKGYRLLFAQNGEEAINILKSEQPELILMDIQMPKMDGLEATQYIRNQLKLTDIPIIALTALAMPGDRERCLEAGANEYLSKPVKLKLLVETMQQFLNSSPEN